MHKSLFSRNNSISGATSLKALRKESLPFEIGGCRINNYNVPLKKYCQKDFEINID